VVVALVAIAAYKLRDRPEDLLPLQGSSPSIQGEAGSGARSSIVLTPAARHQERRQRRRVHLPRPPLATMEQKADLDPPIPPYPSPTAPPC